MAVHHKVPVMTTILRQISTGLYFQGGASWTKSAGKALIYRDAEAALDAAYNSPMGGLELNIILFDDPRYTCTAQTRRVTR